MILCGIQTNALQINAFQLVLPRFPLVQYFAQDFQLPNLQLPLAQVATPFSDMPIAGDKPIFAPFTFNFLVNEDMSNFEEVQKWIVSIGFAESNDMFSNYQNKDNVQRLGEQDAKVLILDSKGNPIRTITFYDAIPIALSGMEFTTQNTDTNYLKASVTMAYTHYQLS